MFDILEADIVIMQEAKIQRKDLTDDMVLVSGWDVFFSLPKDKKGRCPGLASSYDWDSDLTSVQGTLESRYIRGTQSAVPSEPRRV